jgi:urease accessory protein UreE
MSMRPERDPSWDARFAPREQEAPPSAVRAAYTRLMAHLAASMGAVGVDAHILGPRHLPADFDTRAVRVVSCVGG